MRVYQGKLSRFTAESKFTTRINTKVAAYEACQEGDDLRHLLQGKRILVDTRRG